jgi:low temperature requirement protein LtrA
MAEPDRRVSTVELFFDLVFVFTITQLAQIVEHRPSWGSVGQALLELLVIYWMYGGFSWLTNALGPSATRQRIVLLLGMAAFFVVSLAVPRAFGTDALAFGIAYLILNLVHLGGFLLRGSATFRPMLLIGRWNLLAATLLLGAGFVPDGSHRLAWLRWVLWGLAVGVQYLRPLVAPAATRDFTISVGHFAERHGLMIIIVLGESLVSVAVAASELPVGWTLIVGTLCGLAATAALWWAYFGGEDEAVAHALAGIAPGRRGWFALVGIDLPTVLMLAGVVAVAAGSRLSLPVLTDRSPTAAAALIAGGAATFLVGSALARLVFRLPMPAARAVAALVVLATAPVGTQLGAAQQLAAVALVIGVLLVLESRSTARVAVGDAAG